MSTPNESQLIAAMKGKASLNGWDVAVSYDLNELNKIILAKMWDSYDISHGTVLNVKDVTEDGSVSYEMKVQRPTLEFLPGEKAAQLVMQFSGDINWNGTQVNIPQGVYQLRVKAPIVGIASSDRPLKTKEELAKAVKTPAHTEIEFNPMKTPAQAQNANTYQLLFHFGGIPHEEWLLESGPSKDKISADPAMAMVKQSLAGWMSEYLDGLDYSIARIGTSEKKSTLQPKSFIFTTHGTKEKPVLTIYMKVHNGSSESGQTNPSFFNDIAPIPSGYTASIIISNAIMANNFITPALEKSLGTTRKGNTAGQGGDDGFDYEVALKEEFVYNGVRDPGFFNSRYIDGTKVQFKDHTIKLRLADGMATWTANFDVYANWQESHLDRDIYGRVKVNFSVNKTSTIKVSDTELTGSNFDFTKADVKLTSTEVGRDVSFGLGKGTGRDVPAEYKDLKVDFKDVEVPIHHINFFLTENILAGDGSLIAVDAQFGLKTPHDVLMLGKVDWKK